MKLIFLTLFGLVYITSPLNASPPHPCQCWPNWNPIQRDNEWHCQDSNSDKTFHCNIEIPPICHCKKSGKDVALPLGHVNCVGSQEEYDDINCNSTPEWEAWFSKNPNYRLYH